MTNRWINTQMDGWMDGQKINVALAHPYHVKKSCSKLHKIPPSSLGGDRVIDK